MNIALILASGSSVRFQNKENKLFYHLQNKPLIYFTLSSFQDSCLVDQIVIVTKLEYINLFKKIVKKYKFTKVKFFVLGGETRQESSFLGLKLIKTYAKNDDLVLIHDAARPFVSLDLIEKLIKKAAEGGVAIPCLSEFDTTIISQNGLMINAYLDRKSIYRLQTPQVFNFNKIYQAHLYSKINNATDDSTLIFNMNEKIHLVKGDENNIKITTHNDLKKAQIILMEVEK